MSDGRDVVGYMPCIRMLRYRRLEISSWAVGLGLRPQAFCIKVNDYNDGACVRTQWRNKPRDSGTSTSTACSDNNSITGGALPAAAAA